MTQLKDVTHFYLGSEVEVIQSFSSNPAWLWENGIHILDGAMLEAIEIQYSFTGLSDANLENYIMLRLRPLSSMTESEKEHLATMLYLNEGESINDFPIIEKERMLKQTLINITDNFGGPHMASWRIGFLVMLYLLKNSFDLFGLCESGQAIDKTKMK